MRVTLFLVPLCLFVTAMTDAWTAKLATHMISANTSTQSKDLEEAERLTADVMKLYREGKFAEAIPPAKRALEIREKALGKDHQQVAQAANNLGTIYVRSGEQEKAESLFKRALKIYEKALGAESAQLTPVLNNLASVYYVKTDYSKAITLYQRVLSIKEKTLGSEHREVADALFNLAESYQAHAEFERAEPLYKRALEIREKTLGANHKDVAVMLERFSCLLWKTKRETEAAQLEARADAILGYENNLTTLSDKDLAAKKINRPLPVISSEMRQSRAMGKVIVKFIVNESGNVVRACAVSGPSVLMPYYEQLVWQTLYAPTIVNNKPVKVAGQMIGGIQTRSVIVAVPSVVGRP